MADGGWADGRMVGGRWQMGLIRGRREGVCLRLRQHTQSSGLGGHLRGEKVQRTILSASASVCIRIPEIVRVCTTKQLNSYSKQLNSYNDFLVEW